MKKVVLVLYCIIGSLAFSYAQDTTFVRTYGGLRYDQGRSICLMPDGGYILAGSSGSFGLGNSDVYVVKVDSFGNYLWSRSYGGSQLEEAFAVQATMDSGFVITGYTNSFGNGGYDVFLLKMKANGDTMWTKSYGGSNWDFGYDVVQTADSGYIVVGETFSFGNGDNDIYLIRTDKNGDTLWTKTYGGPEKDYGRAIAITSDNGYIIAGASYTFDVDSGDAYLVKIDQFGNVLWDSTYGGSRMDFATDVIETIDSNYAFVGTTESFFTFSKDIFFVEVDVDGTQIFSHAWGGTGNDDEGMSIIQTKWNRYYLLGYSKSFTSGEEDFYLLIAKNGGWYISAPSIGYLDSDIGYSLLERPGGGMALLGTTNSIGAGLDDMLMIFTDSLGKDSLGLLFPTSPPYSVYVDTSIEIVPISVGSITNPARRIVVYPNPVHWEATVEINGGQLFDKSIIFNLYDLTGRVLVSTEITGDLPYRFNRSGLRAGVYFYEILIQDQRYTETPEIYKGKLMLTSN